MSQKSLNFPDIHAVFEQVRGERMAQCVHMHVFFDACALRRFLDRMLDSAQGYFFAVYSILILLITKYISSL
jgi:hypothetical protein